jgi:serine/threonine protein kinase
VGYKVSIYDCLSDKIEDIKADNILIEIKDKLILESCVKAELEHPSPRKISNSVLIYVSRRFDLPRQWGRVVLGDLGSAVRGDEKRTHDAQTNVYRSPEVMLKVEWSYPVDIWNVGVMVRQDEESQLSHQMF